MKKLSKQLSAITGEYYVAAEFSRRGYVAAITLRNTDGVDILVSSMDEEKMYSIQVKTTQNKQKWILTKKVEEESSANKFFVFVNIPKGITTLPEYFIVNAKVLADKIFSGHRRWLSEPGKNGKKRNDSHVRQFDLRHFDEKELLSWDELLKNLS